MAAPTTFDLDTRDGVRVVVHRWDPDGPVRGVVNLAHGMAEHALRYDHVARALNEAGIAVVAEDHRGHGASVASEDDLGHLADEGGWVRVLDDLHRVTLQARAAYPDVPVVLLGHSTGSFLAQQYLFTFPDEIDGLVLSGSSAPQARLASAGAILARAEIRRLGPRGHSPLLEQAVGGRYNRAFAPTSTDFDWLSRDEGSVVRYLDDPLCGFPLTTRFYLDLASGQRVIARRDRIRAGADLDTPIYIFSGSEDPVGGAAGVDRLLAHYAAVGMTDVQHRIYEGGRHEMFNEINRDEVIADLVAWLEEQMPG
jgi:alpha-beta hydrolase superfamily lysophospholipase